MEGRVVLYREIILNIYLVLSTNSDVCKCIEKLFYLKILNQKTNLFKNPIDKCISGEKRWEALFCLDFC